MLKADFIRPGNAIIIRIFVNKVLIFIIGCFKVMVDIKRDSKKKNSSRYLIYQNTSIHLPGMRMKTRTFMYNLFINPYTAKIYTSSNGNINLIII